MQLRNLRIAQTWKSGYLWAIASKTVRDERKAARGWSPRPSTARRELQSLSLTSLGLRGVRKAREPGSGPYRVPALRFASRDVGSIRGVRDQLEPLGGLIVCNTSGNSARSSTKSRHWCTTCGEDIPAPGFGEGRAHTHCSIECLEWDLADARKTRDERLNKLYAMRTKWRRKLGGVSPGRVSA